MEFVSVYDNPSVREHLAWLEQHPNFQKDMKVYKQLMADNWRSWQRMEREGKFSDFSFDRQVNKWFDGDILEHKKIDTVALRIKEREKRLVCAVASPVTSYAFITIGYNEQVVTPAVMMMIGQKVSSMKYWDTCKMVHEKHCATGIHHHTHFLVTYSESMAKSKIVQFVFQTCKKFIVGKNFIDIKGTPDKQTSHRLISEFERYIAGDKSPEKMKYVEQDILWRKENNM